MNLRVFYLTRRGLSDGYVPTSKNLKQNKLGLTLLTRYQPFWLSLYLRKMPFY